MIAIEELADIVAGGEGGTVEFKESTGQKVAAAKTLCAFLNGHGGTLVFGVSRKGKLTGQLVTDTTQRDLAAEFVKFEPGYEFPVEYISIDSTHQAIVVKVPAGKAQPYQYDGRAYRRIESTTSAMPQAMYETMLRERGTFRSSWETDVADALASDDLDGELICETARMAVAYGRLDATADVTDPARLLRKFGLAKNGRIYNGAAVLFGKDLAAYPQCYLRMARFVGVDKQDFLDSRNLSGNVFALINEAVAFCFKHLNLKGTTSGRIMREEQLEIPVDAIREALVNAFAHRDYSALGGSVSLAIFDDRIEIRNPGHLPADFPIAAPQTSDDSLPHNPILARVLYLRKTIEMWGRGMGLIGKVCAKANFPYPKVEEVNGIVRVTFVRVCKSVNKSPNKTAKSPNKSVIKSPNKSRIRKRCALNKLESLLPDAMRSDAKQNMLKVFGAIYLDRYVSIAELEKQTALSNGTVKEMINMLKSIGIIFRVGAKKNGHWMISEEFI